MRSRSASGFTLIELMIVVATIGVLAAVAIPVFRGYQLRTKRTEGMTNVEALVKMARGHFGEQGFYAPVGGSWPAGAPVPSAVAWDPASTAQFSALGFKAEGSVRYRYDLDATGGGFAECPCVSCFTAVAYSDLDGDTGFGGIGYFQRDTATGVECPTTILGWVAPLDRGGVAQYDVVAPWLQTGGGADDY
jgi:prepilin-type N-terminal cleavage/methylation domain-containing protein